MHILTFTTLFPNARQPVHGLFIRNRMEAFTRRYGHKWTVVAPVPWFPKLPFAVSPMYDAYARVAAKEEDRGYPVYHPRYLVTPVVGMKQYGGWMAQGAAATVRRIHAQTPIDVIDAHYAYPDGTAACRIGKELGIPVVLSARGTDLNLFTRMPDILPRIQANYRDAARLICVSNGLAKVALATGAEAAKISVIGNGIDPALFHALPPQAAVEARRSLGLPADKRILLSVGHLVELKGFHLAIEALAALKRDDVIFVAVGEGAQRHGLEALAARLGVTDKVRLPGAVKQPDLPKWYAAADLFTLMSSREGWPNVVTEAQAMGLPVVATRVGDIEDLVSVPDQGMLLEERSAGALATALDGALGRQWDRDAIAKAGAARTWEAVSERLEPVFRSVVGR